MAFRANSRIAWDDVKGVASASRSITLYTTPIVVLCLSKLIHSCLPLLILSYSYNNSQNHRQKLKITDRKLEEYISFFGKSGYCTKSADGPFYIIHFQHQNEGLKMLNKIHTIYGLSFRVSENLPLAGDTERIPPAPYENPSKNGKNFLQLNDCIYQILEYLPIPDLICVGRTCHALQNDVMDLFRTKPRTLYLGSDHKSVAFSPEQIMSAVRIFGPHVKELVISTENIKVSHHNKVIAKIAEHCTGLTSLELVNVTINRSMLPDLHNLFFELETLRLSGCRIYRYCDEKVMNLFTNCDSLLKLKLEYLDGIDSVNAIKVFPNLEAFTYIHESHSVFVDNLIQQHAKLKKLHIDTKHNRTHTTLHDISASCKEIEKLYLIQSLISLRKLNELEGFEHLKKFKLNCNSKSVSTVFASLQAATESLEYLELRNGKVDWQLFEHLKRFENLKVLALIEMQSLKSNLVRLTDLPSINELILMGGPSIMTNDSLIHIVDGLQNLNILSLWNADYLPNEDTLRMVYDIYNRRNPGQKFLINIYESRPLRTQEHGLDYSELVNLNIQCLHS